MTNGISSLQKSFHCKGKARVVNVTARVLAEQRGIETQGRNSAHCHTVLLTALFHPVKAAAASALILQTQTAQMQVPHLFMSRNEVKHPA